MIRCLESKLEYKPSIVHVWTEFKPAYRWLQKKLGFRNPPVWFWTQRPDVPFAEGYGPVGDTMYLVTAKIPSTRIVYIDYAMWGFIISGQYLALTEKEWDEKEKHPPSPDEIVGSWDRIFQSKLRRDTKWLGRKRLQALTERLLPQDLVNVEQFKIQRKEDE